MTQPYTQITACRLCGSTELKQAFDAGTQYVVSFPYPGERGNRIQAPLNVVACQACGLAQLEHTVDRDSMYREYGYRTSVSGVMREAMHDLVQRCYQEVGQFHDEDVVVDIGSNDSTTLKYFQHTIPQKVRLFGFEPAQNIDHADPHIQVIKDYFTVDGYTGTIGNRTARLITSIAMFYDVPDPRKFLRDIKSILVDDGVWCCQMNYLPEIMRNNAVDFLSHEHLTMWRALDLEYACGLEGLEIYHVEMIPLNGGTARFWIQHKGGPRTIQSSITDTLDQELTHPESWDDFKSRVNENRWKVRSMVTVAYAQGKRVAVLGASTRGLALLQYCGLDNKMLEFASDRDPAKWGRQMVGVNIPIVSEAHGRELKPDVYLVLPYSYLKELSQRERAFLENGGKFIVPVPVAKELGAKELFNVAFPKI